MVMAYMLMEILMADLNKLLKPGTTWEIDIPVTQEAGMSWYHPHFMGKTAEHVHSGLAGIYLIEDENSKSLKLPKNYGVDDIPLIIQDRSFSDGIMDPYSVTTQLMTDGLRGDTLVINGTVNAYHVVSQGLGALKIIKRLKCKILAVFYLSNKSSFYKIATEGGFLNKPVAMDELVMAPGERNEIMIDVSKIDTVNVMAEFLPIDPEDQLFFMSWFNPIASVVELRTDASITTNSVLPEVLNNITYYTNVDEAKAVVRNISLEMGDGGDGDENVAPIDLHNLFTINGRSMSMQRIDERVKKGDLEVWRIVGDEMPHPFHVHGVSFQILRHQGQVPAEADRGWKDTVVVGEEPTDIIMRFNYTANDDTPYMYHCHILEHEDGGMMGQFTVK